MLKNVNPHEVPANDPQGPDGLIEEHKGKRLHERRGCFRDPQPRNYCWQTESEPIVEKRHHKDGSHREGNRCSFEVIRCLRLRGLFPLLCLLMLLNYKIGQAEDDSYGALISGASGS